MKLVKINMLFKYLFRIKFIDARNMFRILSATDIAIAVFSFLTILLSTYNLSSFKLEQSILLLSGNFSLLTYRYVRFTIFSKEQESTNQILNILPFKKYDVYLVNLMLKFLYLLKIVLVISFLQFIYISSKFNYIIGIKYLYFVLIIGMIACVMVEFFRIFFHALSYKFSFSRYIAGPLIITISLIFSIFTKYVYFLRLFLLNLFSTNLFLIAIIPLFLILILILTLFKNDFNYEFKIKKQKKFKFLDIYTATNVDFDNIIKKRDLYQIFMLSISIVLPFYDAIISFILINSFNILISIKEIAFFLLIITSSGFSTLVYSIVYSEYPKSIEIFEQIPSFNKNALIFNRMNRIIFFLVLPALIVSLPFKLMAPLFFIIIIGLSCFFLVVTYLFLRKEKVLYYSPYNSNEGPSQIIIALINVVLSTIIVTLLILFKLNFYLILAFSFFSIIMIFLYLYLNCNIKYVKLYKNFKQFSNLDCGLAAIRTMLYTKGILISNKETKDILKKYGKKEFSFQILCEIAKTKNILIEGYHCSDFNKYCNKINYPIIAQVKSFYQMHFIVIFEIKDKYAFIGDPNNLKSKNIRTKKLLKKMTGNILMFE